MKTLSTHMASTESNKPKSSSQPAWSFFDHEDTKDKEGTALWVKPTPELINSLGNSYSVDGPLEKKGRATGFWRKRHYFITTGYLYYKSVFFWERYDKFR